MISAQDNELLTRVGRGTVMGEFMRQFWVPACMSSELQLDGAPLRLMILGEKLVGFRDSSNRVGIMDHQCPHRCASLFFGRNENNGLRCVYHGWKFDVAGNCLEMPNVPAKFEFSPKIKAKAYRTAERNGLVYVYMGNRESSPPLPELDALLMNPAATKVSCRLRECNWLQSLEGDIDTSHFGFLHLGGVKNDEVDVGNLHSPTVLNRAPEYFCKDTDWGTMYCAYRDAPEPQMIYYRFSHFHLPFWTQTPDGTFEDNIGAVGCVPMDDAHTMTFFVNYKDKSDPLRHRKDGSPIPGLEPDANKDPVPVLPNDSSWFGRWRAQWNRSNDYCIDRDAQRNDNFSGITSVTIQDQAMVESMGAIADRTLEHLSPSDIMVSRTRRRLIRAARLFAENGQVPEIVEDPSLSRGARSGSFRAEAGVDWMVAYEGARARSSDLMKAVGLGQ